MTHEIIFKAMLYFSADYNYMYNKCSTGFAVPQADDRQTL
jgi:hypothetical protein